MRLRARELGGPLCAAICVCVVCARPVFAEEATPPLTAAIDGPEPNQTSNEPTTHQATSESTSVSPPTVVDTVPAVYPPEALAAGLEAEVELLVAVLTDGTVGSIEVAASAGMAFDAAAIAAVRQWRFRPAHREGSPIDSRVRVPFRFILPPTQPPGAAVPKQVAAPIEPLSADRTAPLQKASPAEAAVEVVVNGEREVREEDRSASDFRMTRDVLISAPHQEGADVLRTAPGVYVGRAEGPAVAQGYMLRGFDAEHGQDIEFRVGGLPINMPSHIHGQGYADLGFLIGDTVRELRITEGVSDPRQGDFAVAGSIDLTLGVEEEERGVRFSSAYGSFDTFRHVALWAPREANEESFGAVQFTQTSGFGENRAGQSGSAIVQHRFGTGDTTYRTLGIAHAARSDLAGVLRADDVDAGRVCFYCVYSYPTAKGQNAAASRVIVGLFGDHATDDGANGQLGVWLGYDSFRLQKNFTGFLHQSRVLERVAGRGDLIEQQNRTLSVGLTGRYRTSPFRPAPGIIGTVEVGTDTRTDVIEQAQNVIDASVRNQTWDQRVDASVRGADLGAWGDLDFGFTKYVRLRAGIRADLLSYDVDDRLGNFAPLIRSQDSFIRGFRRSALGLAWGPRTSAEVRPLEWLSVLAAYGEGYRSPQARLLEDGEAAPFSKVRSADLGLRFDWSDPLRLTIGTYATRLSDDVAFEAEEARFERIGATQRLGAFAHALTRPREWLVGSLSATFVDATLLEPPPPTAEEPQPPFVDGQRLPLVPPLVVRTDVGMRHALDRHLAGEQLSLRSGVGFSFLSPRPLPYGDFSAEVSLLDLSVGLSWGRLALSGELFNVLGSQYSAFEYTFPSDWDPNDGVRPRTPARHTAAGAPRSWMVSLGVTL